MVQRPDDRASRGGDVAGGAAHARSGLREAAWPIAIASGAVALLSSTFLYGTPLDEEEFRFAILSAWLRVRGLVGGEYPLWFSGLGFGVSQPFVPNFGFHPLTPLLAALTPVTWVRVFLFTHTIAGAVGIWLVCRYLKMAAAVCAVCVVTYLFAAPVQNYLLSDFWPSHYVVWTLVPWVLLLAWRILEEPQRELRQAGETRSRRGWREGLALGLVTGVTLANTNPGHAAVYAALALGIVAGAGRRVAHRWATLALALAVAAALIAPNVAHLVGERRLFDPSLALSNLPDPLPLRSALAALWRPLGGGEDTRTLFLGAPLSVLALVGCVWLARVRADLAIAAAVAAVMLFTASIPAPSISARYHFRDPLTLCAILLAGCIVDRLWHRRATRPVAAVALLLQATVVIAAAWPLVARTWQPDGRRATAFRGATGDASVSNELVAAMDAAQTRAERAGGPAPADRAPARLLYSPRVDHAVAERVLVDDGLGLNALAYRGVAVVNGTFKAVSTDTLWPNDRLFYGWIRTPQALVDSDASLDVLGIRYVLSYRGERVASGLREIWSGTTIRGAELTLLENSDAGPGAFLIEFANVDRELPVHPGCGHDRLLCKDVGALRDRRDRDVATIERGFNEIRIAWPPVAQPRMLIVSEMYRPEWIATSGTESLHVRSMYGGFIGVGIPPGVASVRLRYRPRAIIAASVVCYATAIVAVAALALTTRRRARRPPAVYVARGL